jgi:hypothetical protein
MRKLSHREIKRLAQVTPAVNGIAGPRSPGTSIPDLHPHIIIAVRDDSKIHWWHLNSAHLNTEGLGIQKLFLPHSFATVPTTMVRLGFEKLLVWEEVVVLFLKKKKKIGVLLC